MNGSGNAATDPVTYAIALFARHIYPSINQAVMGSTNLVLTIRCHATGIILGCDPDISPLLEVPAINLARNEDQFRLTRQSDQWNVRN